MDVGDRHAACSEALHVSKWWRRANEKHGKFKFWGRMPRPRLPTHRPSQSIVKPVGL